MILKNKLYTIFISKLEKIPILFINQFKRPLMQTLSEVPFDQLRVGARVKSKVTNNEGFISCLIDITQARRHDDNEIIINWSNGNISYQWHYNYDMVWLM